MKLGLVCKLTKDNCKKGLSISGKIGKSHKEFINLPHSTQLEKLIDRTKKNIDYTLMCLEYCKSNNIKSYRISADLIPKAELWDWQDNTYVQLMLNRIKNYNINLTFHCDHFVKLGSLSSDVDNNAINIFNKYYIPLAECLKIHSICIHVAGYKQGKELHFKQLLNSINRLSNPKLIALENCHYYSPYECLEFCIDNNIQFIFDLHHARVHDSSFADYDSVISLCRSTWNKEPLCHISSGASGEFDSKHAEEISKYDWNKWKGLLDGFIVDVETGKGGKEKSLKKLLTKFQI